MRDSQVTYGDAGSFFLNVKNHYLGDFWKLHHLLSRRLNHNRHAKIFGAHILFDFNRKKQSSICRAAADAANNIVDDPN